MRVLDALGRPGTHPPPARSGIVPGRRQFEDDRRSPSGKRYRSHTWSSLFHYCSFYHSLFYFLLAGRCAVNLDRCRANHERFYTLHRRGKQVAPSIKRALRTKGRCTFGSEQKSLCTSSMPFCPLAAPSAAGQFSRIEHKSMAKESGPMRKNSLHKAGPRSQVLPIQVPWPGPLGQKDRLIPMARLTTWPFSWGGG